MQYGLYINFILFFMYLYRNSPETDRNVRAAARMMIHADLTASNESTKGNGMLAPRGKSGRRTQGQRSAETQRRLLEATIACIVERGYAGTSTTEVCRRAGLSRGAQVHHYPAKAELVAAAIEHLFARRHEEFRASLANAPSLEQAFADLWALYSGPTVHAWMELVIAARTDLGLREHLRAVDQRFFAEATQTCRSLLRLTELDEAMVAALSRVILSVLDGLSLNRTLTGDDQAHRASLELFQRMLALLLAEVRR